MESYPILFLRHHTSAAFFRRIACVIVHSILCRKSQSPSSFLSLFDVRRAGALGHIARVFKLFPGHRFLTAQVKKSLQNLFLIRLTSTLVFTKVGRPFKMPVSASCISKQLEPAVVEEIFS